MRPSATLHTHQLGKRFRREWIFSDLTLDWRSDQAYAITGRNGSGKSTLLQVLAGFLLPEVGQLRYTVNDRAVPPEQIFAHLSLASPALELIEEFTLAELLAFQATFKPWPADLHPRHFAERVGLRYSAAKPIAHFSSGMKQRVKLGLALYAQTSLLLLDEPTVNLDAAGTAWYQEEIVHHTAGRLVMVASNLPQEYTFCQQRLHLDPA